MAGRDDLIHGFSRLVMQEAGDRRQQILQEIEESKIKLLQVKEQQFLEQAYISVQEAVKETKRIRNEEYSKAVLMSKKTLLQERATIMDVVFSNVIERFLQFKKTDKYEQWLNDLIDEGHKNIGCQTYIISCLPEDKALIDKIITFKKLKATTLADLDGSHGGIIMTCEKQGILLDLTVYEMVKEARVDFLSYCGLCVLRW
ncbi:MAG: hypothetical protein KAG94_05090 [Clostridiales bacterium]|nr:hypothetical protein [Clostridiales bacterium]